MELLEYVETAEWDSAEVQEPPTAPYETEPGVADDEVQATTIMVAL